MVLFHFFFFAATNFFFFDNKSLKKKHTNHRSSSTAVTPSLSYKLLRRGSVSCSMQPLTGPAKEPIWPAKICLLCAGHRSGHWECSCGQSDTNLPWWGCYTSAHVCEWWWGEQGTQQSGKEMHCASVMTAADKKAKIDGGVTSLDSVTGPRPGGGKKT